MKHRFGKGRVVWGRPLREVLTAEGAGQDFGFSGQAFEPDLLDFIHRTVRDMDLYFVVNRKDRTESRECLFRASGRRPEIWDPVTGEIRDAAAFTQAGGKTALPLEFAPHQSFFVVFRKPVVSDTRGEADRNFPKAFFLQNISGPWKVAFDPQWGGPELAEFSELISWTRRPEAGIRFYSGKATYRKTFDLVPGATADARKHIYLDLGRAKDVAVVRLNGKDLGILWTAPWRLDITDIVRPAGNVLEVEVINLWANRVIGDLNLPKEKRLTKTHDAFRFDMITKNTPLRDSGLFGPVVLLR